MVSQRDIAYWQHDFIDSTDILQYEVNQVGGDGTAVTAASSPNGYMTIDSATQNAGPVVQFDDNTVDNAAAFIAAAANRVIIWEARLSIDDIYTCDWFVGIGEVDTTFMSAAGAITANGGDNCAGFRYLLSGATGIADMVNCGTALANIDITALGSGVDYGGRTLSSPTLAASTKISFGVRIEETNRVEFYINSQLVGVQTSTAAFDTAMTPTFCLMNDDGVGSTMLVDYVMVAQTRTL
jgi:hypothetical protein